MGHRRCCCGVIPYDPCILFGVQTDCARQYSMSVSFPETTCHTNIFSTSCCPSTSSEISDTHLLTAVDGGPCAWNMEPEDAVNINPGGGEDWWRVPFCSSTENVVITADPPVFGNWHPDKYANMAVSISNPCLEIETSACATDGIAIVNHANNGSDPACTCNVSVNSLAYFHAIHAAISMRWAATITVTAAHQWRLVLWGIAQAGTAYAYRNCNAAGIGAWGGTQFFPSQNDIDQTCTHGPPGSVSQETDYRWAWEWSAYPNPCSIDGASSSSATLISSPNQYNTTANCYPENLNHYINWYDMAEPFTPSWTLSAV